MRTNSQLTLSACLLSLFFVSESRAAGVRSKGPLLNDPAREAEFMDWGLGMFVHWSHDSQLGSVISHSMVGASEKYLDRYINELPKTFNPKRYAPDEWMEIAKIAGVKYMVMTTKHHNGFCMWDTETTDFGIMNTPYGKDVVKDYVDACRRHGLKVGFYFSPEDFIFLHRMGETVRRVGTTGREKEGLLAYHKRQLDELFGNDGPIDIVFFDGGEKEKLTQYVHKLQPQCIVRRGEMETPEQRLPKEPMPGPWESCSGQNGKVLEYNRNADPQSRFKQTEAGLEISVMRAQRIYNNRSWPNTVVVRLDNVEFVER